MYRSYRPEYRSAYELAIKIGMPDWWWRAHTPIMDQWTPPEKIMETLKRYAKYKQADPVFFEETVERYTAEVKRALLKLNT